MSSKPPWTAALQAIADGADAGDLEGQHLEFKSAEAPLKQTLGVLAEAAVCFANADGGTIVVGVRDRGGPLAIRGVGADLTGEVVRRGIFDRTQPQITVFAEEVDWHGVRVLVLTVPPAVVPCATADGRATRRLDVECRPFTPDQQREWRASRGLHDWSANDSGVGLEAVDAAEVERVRRLLRTAGHDDLANQPLERLLTDLRLLERGTLRNAGVVLLGLEDALATAIPNHGYGYQFRPTAGSESTARQRGARPLLAAIDQILDAVQARSQIQPLNIAGGQQLVLTDYPAAAVREIVVNAFIHRSYESSGTVEVEHSPDGLDVTSPGGLVSGVTAENILTHPPVPRNRLLTETVALLRIAERTGQGIDRAYRELLRVGKPPVTIADSGSLTRVHAAGGRGNAAFARFVASLPSDTQGDLEVLLTLSLLCDRRTTDADQMSRAIQRPTPEAAAVLARLASDGAPLIEPTRRGRTYRLTRAAITGLGRAVRYHAAVAGDFDEKVADHLAEYGTISNRTLQRLFDLTVWGARDALRDLQQRGVVEKLPGPARGPSVQYGPGPAIRGR